MPNNNPDKDHILSNLITAPLPLYHKDFPIILFWNPKCGCTSLIKWFYFQVGLLQEANEFSEWIHHYREQIFEAQSDYQLSIKNEITHGNKDMYKLVRNPFKRAVSSYFAVLAVPEIMNQIAPGVKNGLSFRQFLYRLRAIGVNREEVNSHIAMQYIEGEELFIKNYIKLEEFNAEIRNFEKKYRLSASPLEEISKSHHHVSHNMNQNLKSLFADVNMFPSIMKNSQLPPYQNFYDAVTKRLVQKIYRNDFIMFGYDLNHL
ncbi:sulfotransferase family 2 domain-containing protein [Fictibacillus barbaricus]|uniref:Sulfotransferase family protein n=1 Tax=Fictibacillus barbaricus TaxID=182136 RepID=A0ABU1TXV9_9BACL|nr:sulfotransferase family 2 domain-containing protein [Fictibacillus barbaricus]MDR7072036.1 hypothetical protein [Fictibacillus barbaricus]